MMTTHRTGLREHSVEGVSDSGNSVIWGQWSFGFILLVLINYSGSVGSYSEVCKCKTDCSKPRFKDIGHKDRYFPRIE
jgi:hypothetical protein